jgi:hypothetical protein
MGIPCVTHLNGFKKSMAQKIKAEGGDLSFAGIRQYIGDKIREKSLKCGTYLDLRVLTNCLSPIL